MSSLRGRDILALGGCGLCGGPLMAKGLPLFYRITVERFGIDLGAVSRRAGLGMLLGSHALASAMGPDEELARPMFAKPVQLGVCEACAADDSKAMGVVGCALEAAE